MNFRECCDMITKVKVLVRSECMKKLLGTVLLSSILLAGCAAGVKDAAVSDQAAMPEACDFSMDEKTGSAAYSMERAAVTGGEPSAATEAAPLLACICREGNNKTKKVGRLRTAHFVIYTNLFCKTPQYPPQTELPRPAVALRPRHWQWLPLPQFYRG